MPAVLSPAALTTLENVKEALGVTGSGQDDAITRAINRTTAWIEAETGRKLKARNYGGGVAHATTTVVAEDYIYFDGSTKNNGGHTIISERGLGEFHLPQWPVQKYHASSNPNALQVELAVLSDRESDMWDTAAFVENRDYIVDYANGFIRLLAGVFTAGLKNYRIKCTAGYQVGAAQPYVPDDLEGLCVDLCRQVYRNTKNLQSETIGTWSRTYNVAKEDPLVTSVLAKYFRNSL